MRLSVPLEYAHLACPSKHDEPLHKSSSSRPRTSATRRQCKTFPLVCHVNLTSPGEHFHIQNYYSHLLTFSGVLVGKLLSWFHSCSRGKVPPPLGPNVTLALKWVLHTQRQVSLKFWSTQIYNCKGNRNRSAVCAYLCTYIYFTHIYIYLFV